MDTPRVALIKNIYLYLVSFVALMIVVFSLGDIINIALRTYLFPKADNAYYGYYPEAICESPTSTVATREKGLDPPCVTKEDNERNKKREEENRASQRQRDLVRDISFLIVGLPLFAYHWHLARRKE